MTDTKIKIKNKKIERSINQPKPPHAPNFFCIPTPSPPPILTTTSSSFSASSPSLHLLSFPRRQNTSPLQISSLSPK